nr:TrkA family potassium uptake protein [uncultured Caproiciproducens sp.]
MKIFNREKRENIVIAGCGRLGSKLALNFCNQNDNVSIIDIDKEFFSRLSGSCVDCFIEGDATDTDILELAGIKAADVLIAATDDDNTNIMIAQIAKEYYKVKRVIARVEDTSKEASYNQSGIITICPLVLSLNELQRIFASEKEA